MKGDLLKQLIYTTLTVNSSTLYATENVKLIQAIPHLNCSELVSSELGLINASKTLIGSLSVVTDRSVTKSSLLLYFMKKQLHNEDGGTDLVTVVVLAHQNVNKTLVLSVLKKIIDKYFEFREDLTDTSSEPVNKDSSLSGNSESGARNKLGEFKLYMNQIVKFEEMQYDSNSALYSYGATETAGKGGSRQSSPGFDLITPNQLVSANEDVDEVRVLMLDNINKILGRGDKINNLVDQTERLQTSSSIFHKNTKAVKRRMWLNNVGFIVAGSVVGVSLVYLLLGFECGYPFFQSCLK